MSFFRFFGRAAKLWYHKDGDHHAAALAYFTPFALTPLIILSVTLVGILTGADRIIVMLLRWGNAIDPGVTELLYQSVKNFDVISTYYRIPIVGIIFLSIMVFITLNSLSIGLHKIWDVTSHGWSDFFRRIFRTALFIVLLQVYLVWIIFFNDSLDYVRTATGWSWWALLGYAVSYISTMLLLALAYGLLALKAPSFSGRLVGASVAGLLLMFSRELVAFHFSTAPVQSLFGAAGLLIVLLVWVYVGSSVIYYGAACARIFDEQRATKQSV